MWKIVVESVINYYEKTFITKFYKKKSHSPEYTMCIGHVDV